MSRVRIVAANWKMNKSFLEAIHLSNEVLLALDNSLKHTKVVIAPPFVYQHTIGSMLKEHKTWAHLGAQNCHQAEKGAYTGEISVDMLASVGTEYVILGHSERRQQANETAELLAKKVDRVLEKGLKVIFCCGEALEVRQANTQNDYVANQLKDSLFHLPQSAFDNLVIAYEPIWAIGTGMTATPEQAQEMHAHIRQFLADKYGQEMADKVSILYGGSCNATNAKSLFSQPDIDGGLIGGAALVAQEFVNIVKTCDTINKA